MKKIFLFISILFLSFEFSCSKDNTTPTVVPPTLVDTGIAENFFIRAADISFLPEMELANVVFKNASNSPENMLTTLKNAGCNTIRIRLWKNPTNQHSGFEEVKTFATRVKAAGMKVWLTVHYSDTWADPGAQTKPAIWSNLSFLDLKTAVENYTSEIVTQIKPDIIQIGNEINDGFLWPSGRLTTNENQFLTLLAAASAKIRTQSPLTKIMIHYAGINAGASWFFNKINTINYDYIGLSYYPMFHGKILNEVKNTINSLGLAHNKKVIIAETAYPFTFGYNDWTNNLVGLPSQIIPDYPASIEGQKNYLLALKSVIKSTTHGIGFAYWGGEWVAFKGNQATNGSSYENQALWDFNNKALPAMDVFNNN